MKNVKSFDNMTNDYNFIFNEILCCFAISDELPYMYTQLYTKYYINALRLLSNTN